MLSNAQTKMLVTAVPPCPQCRRRAFSRLLTRVPCYVGIANPVAELSEATAGNSSVLRGLDRLKDQDNARLIKSPVQTRLKRIQVASAQVDSLERLADLEQFSTARLQLRKGALMSLRKDLEDARLTYPGITAQVTQDIKNELEALDQSLRAEDAAAIKIHLRASHDLLTDVVNAVLSAAAPELKDSA